MHPMSNKEIQNKIAVTRAKNYLKQRRITAIGFDLLPESDQLKIKQLIEKAKSVDFLSNDEIIKLIKDSLDFDVNYKLIYHVVNKYNITYDNSKRLKNVFIKRFGVDNPGRLPEVKEKIKKTNLKNGGCAYSFQRPDVIKKIKQTKLDRYGDAGYHNIEKMKQTNLDRYGVECSFQVEEVKEKAKQTCFEKYGVFHPMQTITIQEKLKQSFFNKFGYDSPLKNPDIKQKQAKSAKSSQLEKKVKEFLKNNKFDYKTQYVLNNECSSHAFDFAIFKNNKLEILIDCDGLYYHGYLCDFDDKRVKSKKYDDFRLQLIPKNVKFIIVIEKHEEECFKEIFKCFDMNYNDYIKYIFDWCRSIDFPYPTYTPKILLNGWNKLNEYNFEKYKPGQMYGLKIINQFHKSIWNCTVNNKPSIYTAWHDDNLLLKVIKNRLIYKNNIDPSKILAGFNVSKIAPKISIFNPVLTKYLITKYLSNYNTIRDPFSGYSGRLLGTLAANKKYIGSDINKTTIDESLEICKFINKNADLFVKDILLTNEVYHDCAVLTCPPYNNKENWNMPLQNLSCDDWIDITLNNIKANKYLFVVDNTIKYKNNIVETLSNNSHFNNNNEYVILI